MAGPVAPFAGVVDARVVLRVFEMCVCSRDAWGSFAATELRRTQKDTWDSILISSEQKICTLMRRYFANMDNE